MSDKYENRFEYMKDYATICSLYISEYMEQVVEKRAVTNSPFEKYKGLVVSLEEAREGYSGKPDFRPSETLLRKASGLYGDIMNRVSNTATFLPIEYLANVFDLDFSEKLILAAGYMVLFDRSFEKTYAYINDNVNERYLYFDTAIDIFAGGDRQLGILLYDSVIKLLFMVPDDGYIGRAALKPCRRMSEIIYESRIVPHYRWGDMFYPSMEMGQIIGNEAACREIESIIKRKQKLLVSIEGRNGAGRKSLLKKAVKELRYPVLFIDFDIFHEMSEREGEDTVIESVIREMLLQQCLICIYNVSKEHDTGFLQYCISRWTEAANVIFVCVEEKEELPVERIIPIHHIELEKLDMTENIRLWSRFNKELDEDISLPGYANRYEFTPDEIRQVIEYAERTAELNRKDSISKELLDNSCRMLMKNAFDGKAVCIEQKFTFDDLIIPAEQKDQIREGLNHILYKNVVYEEWGFKDKLSYGKGLAILFAGAPGTGKTMAAGVIGRELGLPVYKVDISQMISKYIGETEKSLGAVFDIASKSNCILFFDEMDALFGKRSEVKDSHDKYANIETAYLLQKIEDYEGVVLMSTNFQQNIDEAFVRRINYIIKFPMPDKEYREKLWRSMFTDRMPVEENMDFEFLAGQFEMSGASIKSAVMSAAFMAAEEKSSIGMKHILKSVKRLMMKQGKMIFDGDYGKYSAYLYM